MDIRQLSDTVSVAPQIEAREVAEVARLGFRTVINNRPDNEAGGQPSSAEIEAAARAAGLAYHHQPVISGALSVDNVVDFHELLAHAEGPVLAFCRSGTRCANLWALAQAGQCDPDQVIGAAARAGYDVSGMRHVLAAGLPKP
jgi:sulfide:quinone oxidoreductase